MKKCLLLTSLGIAVAAFAYDAADSKPSPNALRAAAPRSAPTRTQRNTSAKKLPSTRLSPMRDLNARMSATSNASSTAKTALWSMKLNSNQVFSITNTISMP